MEFIRDLAGIVLMSGFLSCTSTNYYHPGAKNYLSRERTTQQAERTMEEHCSRVKVDDLGFNCSGVGVQWNDINKIELFEPSRKLGDFFIQRESSEIRVYTKHNNGCFVFRFYGKDLEKLKELADNLCSLTPVCYLGGQLGYKYPGRCR